MQDLFINYLGVLRLISFVLIIAAGFLAFGGVNRKYVIAFLTLFLVVVFSSVYAANGLLVGGLTVAVLFLLPFFSAPVLYAVQWITLKRVERLQGKSDIELSIDWLGFYKILSVNK